VSVEGSALTHFEVSVMRSARAKRLYWMGMTQETILATPPRGNAPSHDIGYAGLQFAHATAVEIPFMAIIAIILL
jgi:hypothetical protein